MTSAQIRGWKTKLHELSVNIKNKDGERGEKKKDIKYKHGCFRRVRRIAESDY
jgi:hypothetical protein